MRTFEAGDPNTVLILDAKSRVALDTIQQLVGRLGIHRVVVHGFAKELSFEPMPEGVERQVHWVDEDLPLADIVRAACPPGGGPRAGVMVTCRHVTPERVGSKEWGVVESLASLAAQGVDVAGLWLPGGRAPPREVAAQLLEQGLLVSYNVGSEVLQTVLLPPFVGMTDVLSEATITEFPSEQN